MSTTTLTTQGPAVPAHLRQFVVDQHYAKYTPVDQAVWRYVLRQNSAFLQEKGYGSYRDGLLSTGMSIESIPDITTMSAELSAMGWGAVAVDGFIPPVAFFDFQAHGILPIACDMRTLAHIAYTPAPDIIHESAGHAPMLHDEAYGRFLRRFGEIGRKALSSKEDLEVYEAIRLLSILKEDPKATDEQIAASERRLDAAIAAVTSSSEATLLARLYWWTVEYGLIGDLEDPKIYGAGLLSSMGESRSCLAPAVRKIPFSLEACIATDYDITKPQPQLFVCRDFDQLTEAIERFAAGMAFRVGGTQSLVKAVDSGATATAVYASGLQVTGTFTDLVFDEQGEAVYLKTTGSSALAYADQELPGHDQVYHGEGFGSPVGLLQGYSTPLEDFSDLLLQRAGIVAGCKANVKFRSGVRVEGIVKEVVRRGGKIVLIAFNRCTVTLGETVLFRAEWGTFDMAVGAKIVSVFAGAADPERFHASAVAVSATVTGKAVLSEEERALHRLYTAVRDLREGELSDGQLIDSLADVLQQIEAEFAEDWLLRVEILEILTARGVERELQERVEAQLVRAGESDEEKGALIENGMKLMRVGCRAG
ncbi:aromatic amino acid hydroxylase [Tumebacillus sp. DT12]|uniref:Aromatic amino acid hydroxylase n=1 Tax=Tumebacillus lacus TaxID=2995335 RepID=A0ABT3X5V0_9BACL|nr:aromatic amino acid hydroxylase [Tumebacillus lacus]MCX7570094.1 aromatic amino acid hydroxylase [Tumebacillus lacus]